MVSQGAIYGQMQRLTPLMIYGTFNGYLSNDEIPYAQVKEQTFDHMLKELEPLAPQTTPVWL